MPRLNLQAQTPCPSSQGSPAFQTKSPLSCLPSAVMDAAARSRSPIVELFMPTPTPAVELHPPSHHSPNLPPNPCDVLRAPHRRPLRVGQHTELMADMGESFTPRNTANAGDGSTTNASHDDNALELQRWGQWRDIQPTRLYTSTISGGAGPGSAALPIEVDGDGDAGPPTRASANTAPSTVRAGERSVEETETLWGHAVHEHELRRGDQIYVYRGAIQHHGIVIHVPGSGPDGGSRTEATSGSTRPSRVQVVHFDSTCDGVETTSLEDFLKGGTLRRALYSASPWSTGLDYGASYGCASDDPALIVTRATEAAKFGEGASGWSGYSLLTNNCETFAYWCSTGRRQTLSRQATRGLVGAGIVAAGVSAVASAGGLASAGVAATALVPRGVRGVQRGVQALEWATGVAVVAVAAADVVSTLVTRAPVARNMGDHGGGAHHGGVAVAGRSGGGVAAVS
ncbi:unnamed protein product [Scytosiphon promiscuus]